MPCASLGSWSSFPPYSFAILPPFASISALRLQPLLPFVSIRVDQRQSQHCPSAQLVAWQTWQHAPWQQRLLQLPDCQLTQPTLCAVALTQTAARQSCAQHLLVPCASLGSWSSFPPHSFAILPPFASISALRLPCSHDERRLRHLYPPPRVSAACTLLSTTLL